MIPWVIVVSVLLWVAVGFLAMLVVIKSWAAWARFAGVAGLPIGSPRQMQNQRRVLFGGLSGGSPEVAEALVQYRRTVRIWTFWPPLLATILILAVRFLISGTAPLFAILIFWCAFAVVWIVMKLVYRRPLDLSQARS